MAGPDGNLPRNVGEAAFREYNKGRSHIDPGHSEDARKVAKKAYLKGQASIFNVHPQVCEQARTQAAMADDSDGCVMVPIRPGQPPVGAGQTQSNAGLTPGNTQQASTNAGQAPTDDDRERANARNLAESSAQCDMMMRLFMSGVNIFEHNDGWAPPPKAPPPPPPNAPPPYDPSADPSRHASAAEAPPAHAPPSYDTIFP